MKNKLNLPLFMQPFFYLLVALLLSPEIVLSEQKSPLELVKHMSKQFEDDLISHQDKIKSDPSMTSEIIMRTLDSHVNFPLMSRYVLGQNWKKATKEQQDEFVILFKSLLIRFYSKAFNKYLKDHRIEKGMIAFSPYRKSSNPKYAKVKTEIKLNADTSKLKVQYSLYNGKKSGWKIYDLSIEGISLVTSYRSSFKDIIKREKMSGLIKHLDEKLKTP
jgi:phospholipid transport system substrate-binding protein